MTKNKLYGLFSTAYVNMTIIFFIYGFFKDS
jgi:hypothetical protein